MSRTIIISMLVVAFTAGQAAAQSARPATTTTATPSAQQLAAAQQAAAEREKKLDQIVDRFIQYDVGKLTGTEGQKAFQDFQALGVDATPALIRGMNKAAVIQASCPAGTIGQKLGTILASSNDPALLTYARDNIGAGIQKSYHQKIINNLKTTANTRATAIAAITQATVPTPVVVTPTPATTPTPSPNTSLNQPADISTTSTEKSVDKMTVDELCRAAVSETGERLETVLTTLEKRGGTTALAMLAKMADESKVETTRTLARDLIVKSLARMNNPALQGKLRDQRATVRALAARVIGEKKLPFGDDLLKILQDKDEDPRQAARQALVAITGGESDFGPEKDAEAKERTAAVDQWRALLAKTTVANEKK